MNACVYVCVGSLCKHSHKNTTLLLTTETLLSLIRLRRVFGCQGLRASAVLQQKQRPRHYDLCSKLGSKTCFRIAHPMKHDWRNGSKTIAVARSLAPAPARALAQPLTGLSARSLARSPARPLARPRSFWLSSLRANTDWQQKQRPLNHDPRSKLGPKACLLKLHTT